MRLYHVDDDYIEYLRQFDSRVYDNKNGTRPYVGVALTVEGMEYYIPMSSPKPKHDGMKNSIDFEDSRRAAQDGCAQFELHDSGI